MKKKLFALLLAAMMVLSLAACGGGNDPAGDAPDDAASDGAPDSTPDSAPEGGETYVVGISQLVTHEALDAATRGFQDALNELLPGQVTFDVQNAANDPAACASIATSFVSKGVDLIMANATPALQAAAAATADIPCKGTG